MLFLISAACSSAGEETFDCVVNVLQTFRIALKVSSLHLLFVNHFHILRNIYSLYPFFNKELSKQDSIMLTSR